MTSDPDPDKDDDLRAAEYVVHLLDPDERRAFEARLDGDGALRARVAFWADHFAELMDEVPAVAPPKALRKTLENAIAARRSAARSGGVSILRWLGGAGAALALGLAVVSQLPEVRLPSAFTPGLFANISAQDGALVVNIAYSEDTGEIEVERTAGAPPEGRVLQLWAITPDRPGPVSLGVLPDGGAARLIVPEDLQADLPGATLAISEEPPGGSPLPGPSGTVLGAAALTDA